MSVGPVSASWCRIFRAVFHYLRERTVLQIMLYSKFVNISVAFLVGNSRWIRYGDVQRVKKCGLFSVSEELT